MRALGAALLIAGCAAAQRSDPPPSSTAVAPAPPPKKKRPIRVSEVAARMRDDLECEKAVTNLAQHSKKAAWALLLACVNQDKFRNLRMLLEAPWREHLEQRKEWDQLRVIAHVLAIRGGNFPTDIKLATASGVQLWDLKAAFAEPEAHRQRPLVFRGVIEERRLERDGRVRLRIAEVRRRTIQHTLEWQGQQYNLGRVEQRPRTGRMVEAHVLDLPLLVREGNEFVFLAIFGSVSERSVARVKIVDVFRRGVILPDM